MLRKLSTQKNSDQTARVTITGFLIEMQVVPIGETEFEVRLIDKSTGVNEIVTVTTDFDGGVAEAEKTLRDTAISLQIDGYESLDSESD